MNKQWYDRMTALCGAGCGYYAEEKWPDGKIHPVCHFYGYGLDEDGDVALDCEDFKTPDEVKKERQEREAVQAKNKGRKRR